MTSRHSPGTPPRPTRPRSWCSCETPNRSASRIDHRRRVRHVDADLDDRRGDEHVDLAAGEGLHDRRPSRRTASCRAGARRADRANAGCRDSRSTTCTTPQRVRGCLARDRGDGLVRGVVLRRTPRRRSPRTRRTPGAPCATSSAMRSHTRREPRRASRRAARRRSGCRRVPRASCGSSRRRGRRTPSSRPCAGSGVAVSTSACGAAPFARSDSRCSTPKRCCSSTTTSPRSAKVVVVAQQRVRADDDARLTGCRPQRRLAPLGRGHLTGEQRRHELGRELAARASGRSSAGAGRRAPRSGR